MSKDKNKPVVAKRALASVATTGLFSYFPCSSTWEASTGEEVAARFAARFAARGSQQGRGK